MKFGKVVDEWEEGRSSEYDDGGVILLPSRWR